MQNVLPHTTLSRRYIVLDELGRGGMGVVYRAFDRLFGREVALKRLLNSTDEKPDDLSFIKGITAERQLLVQEFRVLSSLRHPHIISVFDFGFDSAGLPYITMEIVEHPRTLIEASADQPLNIQVERLVQMLEALSYLHRRGVLHRDLKPGNVLVQDDTVKVLDFGLAVNKEEPSNYTSDMAGTLAYMAPEVLTGLTPSESADLYAVGVIAYELLTGKYPFSMDSVMELLQEIMQNPPDMLPLAEKRPQFTTIIERLLSKSPAQRYKSATETIAAFNTAIGKKRSSQEALSIRESFLQAAQFIGRQVELEKLHTALDNVIAKQGALWLVGGESGVGKSRLIEETRTRALVKGALVINGQAENQNNTPYHLWRNVLRWLCLLVDVNPFEASVLKPIIPDIESLLGHPVDDAPSIDPRGVPERLLGVITGMFARSIEQQTLVITLEDLQWAGSESLFLLSRLAASNLPILFIGTYRDDESPQLPSQFKDPNIIKLKRLSATEINQLSHAMLGEAAARPQVLSLLERETEGNVFFLVEVVRALAESAGEIEDIGIKTLPLNIYAGGVQAFIQRRLAHIPEQYLPLVKMAAIIGRVFDLNILKTALPTLDIDKGLLLCSDNAVFEVYEEAWRFSHDKIREGILKSISPEDTQALHLQAAATIEELYPNAPDQSPVLAYHWGKALREDKELHYSSLAGEHLLKNGAYQEARSYLQRALGLISVLPSTPNNLQQQLALQLNMAMLVLITKGQGAPETKAAYDRARGLANQIGETPQMFQALFGLWAFYLFSSNHSTAREVAQQCLAMAERFNISGMVMESHVALGNTEFWLGNMLEAKDHMEKVIALYNPAEHDIHLHQLGQDARITSRTYGSWATWMLGYPDQARAHSLEALRIARMRNHLYLVATALQSVAWTALFLGDVPMVLESAGELIGLSEQENFPVFLAIGFMLHGWALTQIGTVEEGIAQIQQGAQIWFAIGSQSATPFQLWLAQAYLQGQHYQEALTMLEEGFKDSQLHNENAFLPEMLRIKGEVLLKLDQTPAAHEVLIAAFSLAKERSAKSYQLQAAMSLFQHFPSDETRQQLTELYGWFTEGLETPMLQQVQQMLAQ